MVVAKFGGTSVKDAAAVKRLTSIAKRKDAKTLIIVSAMAGVTDELTAIINNLKNADKLSAFEVLDHILLKHKNLIEGLGLNTELIDFIEHKADELSNIINAIDILGEVSDRSKDYILSFGEILSSYLVNEALRKEGLNSAHVDSRQFIKTDSNYTEAEVNFSATEAKVHELKSKFDEYDILVGGGFIASNHEGITTTLGRGGSDYSAAIYASFLDADKLEIWTDVDGILTSDPRKIKNVKRILKISYDEASELAYFGAKVLHPKTIYPAVQKNIPVFVLNSYKPELIGTEIVGETQRKRIKAIAFRSGITVININSKRMLGAYGFLSKVFEVFSKYETSVDLITTTEVNISLTIDNARNLEKIKKELTAFADIDVKEGYAIISAIGEGIKNTSGIASRFFGILKDININMVSIGASDINVSITVKEDDLIEAVELLHNEFFSGKLEEDIFGEIKD